MGDPFRRYYLILTAELTVSIFLDRNELERSDSQNKSAQKSTRFINRPRDYENVPPSLSTNNTMVVLSLNNST